MLLNISLIGAALWLAPVFDVPVVALAWGVLAAGIVQLAFQFPFLAALGMLVRPRLRRAHVGRGPRDRADRPRRVRGLSVSQINLLVDTIIASFLVTGSVSWLYFSDRMVEFPLGVFGIALATVILPHLSRQHADASRKSFSDTLDWSLRLVVLIATPGRGRTRACSPRPSLPPCSSTAHSLPTTSTWRRAACLRSPSGLIAFIAVKILATGYFSRQDTRTPVRVGVVAMLSNIVLNLVLVGPAGPCRARARDHALRVSQRGAAAARARQASSVFRPRPGWSGFIVRAAAGNLVLGAVLWLVRGEPAQWFEAQAAARALHLCAVIGTGMVLYAAVMLALGMRPRDFAPPAGRGA